MIKFHPSDEVLRQFAAAQLPASISVAVAIHVDMCECCQDKVADYERQLANSEFSADDLGSDEVLDVDFDSMMEGILADSSLDTVQQSQEQLLEINGTRINVPRALSQIEFGNWQRIGKLARSRMALEDGELRSSMLHIDAGGQVPQHTHTGFEVTLLLDGSFSDEMGTYNKGDFIWLDGQHNHQPETKDGCLCYTVVSDALHFNHGVSRLLNPIGKLIY